MGKGPTNASNDALRKAYLAETSITPNMTASVGNTGPRPTNAALEAMLGNKGGAANKAASGLAGKLGGAAVPGAGAVTGAIPGLINGDPQSAAKGAIGGGASSTLMAAAPAMAAAGPVGWAGIAGLAALSLYGMLG